MLGTLIETEGSITYVNKGFKRPVIRFYTASKKSTKDIEVILKKLNYKIYNTTVDRRFNNKQFNKIIATEPKQILKTIFDIFPYIYLKKAKAALNIIKQEKFIKAYKKLKREDMSELVSYLNGEITKDQLINIRLRTSDKRELVKYNGMEAFKCLN